MAAVRRFSDQHSASATEASRQLPLLRESPWCIEQKIGLKALGENCRKLIQESSSAQAGSLFAALKWSTPYNLCRPLAQGQHGHRALGSKQFKGGGVVGAAQCDF
tara:strand:- start:10 stop:324 length:315 start_codon:yes stop_codon:yes gene_type:complete